MTTESQDLGLILESILLENPHKAAVLSVGCASFSSTLIPSTRGGK